MPADTDAERLAFYKRMHARDGSCSDHNESCFLLRLLHEQEADITDLKRQLRDARPAVFRHFDEARVPSGSAIEDARQKAIYALGWGYIGGGHVKALPVEIHGDRWTCEQMVAAVTGALITAAQDARNAALADVTKYITEAIAIHAGVLFGRPCRNEVCRALMEVNKHFRSLSTKGDGT